MPECLDSHKGDCKGEVKYHPSIAGTGTMIPRCDKHYEALLEWHDEYSQVMPDSPIAPYGSIQHTQENPGTRIK